jgi:hypothetical protein
VKNTIRLVPAGAGMTVSVLFPKPKVEMHRKGNLNRRPQRSRRLIRHRPEWREDKEFGAISIAHFSV